MHNTNYNNWVNNIKIKNELQELQQHKNNPKYIKERFSEYLKFGTGGLRGVMGLGTNYVNSYTITKVSVGLGNFLNSQKNLPKLIVIAYDNRKNSAEFAKLSARVFAEKGIKVKLFKEPTPTPVLSFAVRYFGASFGVNITSSHNSKIYNGYKVVNSFGSQISTQESLAISDSINKSNEFKNIKNSYTHYLKNKSIMLIGNLVFNKFVQKTVSELPANLEFNNSLKLVYSPLNGTGYKSMKASFSKVGYHAFTTPELEKNPDPEFATTPNPNPELLEVYAESIKLAKKENAHLIITTDPDCDRMGAMVLHNNNYSLLTGDQIGIVLLNYLIENKPLNESSFAVNSVVSSPLAKTIANKNNVKLYSTLTGFKNIAAVMDAEINRINNINKTNKNLVNNLVADNNINKNTEINKKLTTNELGESSFLIAFEESNGYLINTHIRDKDGVAPTLLLTSIAGQLLKQNKTLLDYLQNTYERYGFVETKVYSNEFFGYNAKNKMNEVVNAIRNNPPKKVGNKKVVEIVDYLDYKKTGLEKSNFLTLKLKNKSNITIRPSGTEPKLKVYLSVMGKNIEHCNRKLKKLQKIVNKKLLNM